MALIISARFIACLSSMTVAADRVRETKMESVYPQVCAHHSNMGVNELTIPYQFTKTKIIKILLYSPSNL